jgi:hypothetical protein
MNAKELVGLMNMRDAHRREVEKHKVLHPGVTCPDCAYHANEADRIDAQIKMEPQAVRDAAVDLYCGGAKETNE